MSSPTPPRVRKVERIDTTPMTLQQYTFAVTALAITGLPPPADQLFRAVLHAAAADLLIHILTQPS
jgi:hypothetical protein